MRNPSGQESDRPRRERATRDEDSGARNSRHDQGRYCALLAAVLLLGGVGVALFFRREGVELKQLIMETAATLSILIVAFAFVRHELEGILRNR